MTVNCSRTFSIKVLELYQKKKKKHEPKCGKCLANATHLFTFSISLCVRIGQEQCAVRFVGAFNCRKAPAAIRSVQLVGYNTARGYQLEFQ